MRSEISYAVNAPIIKSDIQTPPNLPKPKPTQEIQE